MSKVIFLVTAFVFTSAIAMAQTDPDISDLAQKKANSSAVVSGTDTGTILNQSQEWMKLVPLLCLGLLLFSIFYFILVTFLVSTKTVSFDILKLYVIPLIVLLSVFLVIVGYSQTQLAPVLGLLGTVVGYLLGKDSGPSALTAESTESVVGEVAKKNVGDDSTGNKEARPNI